MITDTTAVSDLFDANPDIIGEISPLLDREKRGAKDWRALAEQMGMSRNQFKHFESSVKGNPTEQLLNYLCSHRPPLTVGEFKRHIQDQKRRDVVKVLYSSSKG